MLKWDKTRYVVRYDLAKPIGKYKPEKNFHERKADRKAAKKMAHHLMRGTMEETEAKWERQRQRTNELLKEIGQDNPPCGFGVGDGWFPIVANALREIAKVGIPWELAQVKQKFCQLRIYVDFPGSGKVVPVDFIGTGKRIDVGMPNEDGAVSVWQEGHPDHPKYLRVNEIIREAEIACDTACESCGAQTEGGAASGWKGCKACKDEERREYEEKYGEKMDEE